MDAGGSVCPEHLGAGSWKISREEDDKWSWTSDPDLEVICVPDPSSESHKEDGAHEEPHRHPPYALPHHRSKQGDCKFIKQGDYEQV